MASETPKEKKLRHYANILRLVRERTGALHEQLEQAQEQLAECKLAEANALRNLQDAGSKAAVYEFEEVGDLFETDPKTGLPWYLSKPADLDVFRDILAELDRLSGPAQATVTEALAVYRQTITASKAAQLQAKKLQLECLIAGNKLDVLAKKETDQALSKYQRNLLKWLIFVDECFADRLDMDVFPVPPQQPMPCDTDCQSRTGRTLHVCDCSVKAAFVFADGLDMGYDLESERRRWHPSQFYACDITERLTFLEKAGKIYSIIESLYHRKRSGFKLM